jgi:hypothetical protein
MTDGGKTIDISAGESQVVTLSNTGSNVGNDLNNANANIVDITKLPRRHCRDAKDQKYLEKWTLTRLAEIYKDEMLLFLAQWDEDERVAREEAREERFDLLSRYFRLREQRERMSERRDWIKRVQRVQCEWIKREQRERIIKAVKSKNAEALVEALVELTDLEQARLAFESAFRRPGRGRKPGEPRSSDIGDDTRHKCAVASDEVELIRGIWKQELGFRNRTDSPTAVEIAARHCDIDPEQLENYRKNLRSRS